MYSRVYVEITNICNLRCSFCHGHSRAPRRMTAQEFSCVLDRLEGVTNHIYYHLMGEPLLHPELPSFIRTANGRGFRSVITTNGMLLDRVGSELIAAKPHKVSISLHSSEGEGAAAAVCVGVTHREILRFFICHSERSVESVSLCNIPPGSGRPMAAPTGRFVGASIARPLP